ncbi:MAG: hypothetical protein JWQ97_1649, partial [Phenylobacterium sp.]|nr:hypothetical protein [Phenylobacterium sp.]
EAASQAAGQPRPVLVATVPQAAPVPSAQDFVNQAAAGDAFEIAAGQVAQQRAQSPAVRAFADMMVHDHTESTSALKKAIAEAGHPLSLATTPSADQQAQLAALTHEDAKSFDKAYVEGQVAAHQAALALLQAYGQNGDEPALKAFAGEAVSVVERHLDQAKALSEQLL